MLVSSLTENHHIDDFYFMSWGRYEKETKISAIKLNYEASSEGEIFSPIFKIGIICNFFLYKFLKVKKKKNRKMLSFKFFSKATDFNICKNTMHSFVV